MQIEGIVDFRRNEPTQNRAWLMTYEDELDPDRCGTIANLVRSDPIATESRQDVCWTRGLQAPRAGCRRCHAEGDAACATGAQPRATRGANGGLPCVADQRRNREVV